MKMDICAGLAVLLLGLSNPLRAQVVLSEVMHDPGGLDHHDEYIELVNTSETEPVDLEGWHLGSDEDLDLLVDKGTGLVLKPGQFALVLDGSYFIQPLMNSCTRMWFCSLSRTEHLAEPVGPTAEKEPLFCLARLGIQ